jgi:hypothetical protein
MHGRDEKFVQNFVGKPEGKKLLTDIGTHGKITIKMDPRKTGLEGVV